jgi:hypothetical protein
MHLSNRLPDAAGRLDDSQKSVGTLVRQLLAAGPALFTNQNDVEVHTLVSAAHLPLYLFAAKSLALHWPEVMPVVHDDGTLTQRDRARLARHVPQLRIIARAEADERVEPLLADFPQLAAVRRGNVRILQIVDYFLLAGSRSVVSMDSDVVFLSRPDALTHWARSTAGQRPVFLYSPEEGWEPRGVHWIPEQLPGVAYVPYMCCGFACADAAEFFDAAYLEEMLTRLPSEIRFAPRFVTQMCYSLLGGRLPAGQASGLGEPYRSGRLEWLPDIDNRVICHYFASHERASTYDNLVEEGPLLGMAIRTAG